MTESSKKDIKESDESKVSNEILEKLKASANYCFNCNRCVNVCPLSQLGMFSPRSLVVDILNLPIEEVIERNNIWNCLTCGLCMVYCPMTKDETGVRIPELILELRKLFMGKEDQIERIAQCETHDGIFPLISEFMVNSPTPPNKLGFLEGSSLKTSKEGDIAYFIGCLPFMEEVTYGYDVNYISTAKTIIELLNEADIAPVVLNEKCCGHDMLWGKGDNETFKKLAIYNIELYRKAGVKTIILSCAEGYRTWKYDYPKVVEDFDFEVLYFSEFFLRENILDNVRFPVQENMKVTYHDACRIGRLGGKLYDSPRELIRSIPGVELIEMENIKDDAKCCGVSAFRGCNEHTRLLRKQRIEEAVATGADYLLVPCPKCLTHFNCYLTEPSLENKKRIKVMDLASFIGKLLFLT